MVRLEPSRFSCSFAALQRVRSTSAGDSRQRCCRLSRFLTQRRTQHVRANDTLHEATHAGVKRTRSPRTQVCGRKRRIRVRSRHSDRKRFATSETDSPRRRAPLPGSRPGTRVRDDGWLAILGSPGQPCQRSNVRHLEGPVYRGTSRHAPGTPACESQVQPHGVHLAAVLCSQVSFSESCLCAHARQPSLLRGVASSLESIRDWAISLTTHLKNKV